MHHRSFITCVALFCSFITVAPVAGQEFGPVAITAYGEETVGADPEDGTVVSDIAAAPDGSLYLTGYFQDTLVFGDLGLRLESAGGTDDGEAGGSGLPGLLFGGSFPEVWYTNAFLAKWHPEQGVVWVRQLDQRAADVWGMSVVANTAGEVYWTAAVSEAGELVLDGSPVMAEPAGLSSRAGLPIVTKFDSAGEFLWARELDLPWPVASRAAVAQPLLAATADMAVDREGNVYVTGGASRAASTSVSFLPFGFHLAKLTSEGVLEWLHTEEDAWGTGLAVAEGGSVYTSGGFVGTAELGGERVEAGSGRSGIFVAVYGTDGTGHGVRLADQLAGQDSSAYDIRTDMAYDLSLDAQRNLYVTGAFGGTARFGGIEVESRGVSEVYTAKYSPGGDVEWVRTGGSNRNDAGLRIETSAGGDAVVLATVHAELVLIHYAPDGETRWFEQSGLGSISPHGQFALTAGTGNLFYFAGSTSDRGTLGSRSIVHRRGTESLFVVPVDP